MKVDVQEDQRRRGRMRETCCLYLQIAVHTVQRNWLSRLERYLMVMSKSKLFKDLVLFMIIFRRVGEGWMWLCDSFKPY